MEVGIAVGPSAFRVWEADRGRSHGVPDRAADSPQARQEFTALAEQVVTVAFRRSAFAEPETACGRP